MNSCILGYAREDRAMSFQDMANAYGPSPSLSLSSYPALILPLLHDPRLLFASLYSVLSLFLKLSPPLYLPLSLSLRLPSYEQYDSPSLSLHLALSPPPTTLVSLPPSPSPSQAPSLRAV